MVARHACSVLPNRNSSYDPTILPPFLQAESNEGKDLMHLLVESSAAYLHQLWLLDR